MPITPEGRVNITGQAYVENEGTLNLTCTAEGGPDNVLMWSLDGIELKDGKYDVTIVTNVYSTSSESILMISSVDASVHKGLYECNVTNVGGSGNNSFLVTG